MRLWPELKIYLQSSRKKGEYSSVIVEIALKYKNCVQKSWFCLNGVSKIKCQCWAWSRRIIWVRIIGTVYVLWPIHVPSTQTSIKTVFRFFDQTLLRPKLYFLTNNKSKFENTSKYSLYSNYTLRRSTVFEIEADGSTQTENLFLRSTLGRTDAYQIIPEYTRVASIFSGPGTGPLFFIFNSAFVIFVRSADPCPCLI